MNAYKNAHTLNLLLITISLFGLLGLLLNQTLLFQFDKTLPTAT